MPFPGSGLVCPSHHQLQGQRRWVMSSVLIGAADVQVVSVLGALPLGSAHSFSQHLGLGCWDTALPTQQWVSDSQSSQIQTPLPRNPHALPVVTWPECPGGHGPPSPPPPSALHLRTSCPELPDSIGNRGDGVHSLPQTSPCNSSHFRSTCSPHRTAHVGAVLVPPVVRTEGT